MHIIWIGVLLGIGLILAPLVLRLAILAIGFTIMVAIGLALLVLVVNYPGLLVVFAIYGAIIALIIWIPGVIGRRLRERNIQAMRHHFAEEMEIRLRNEGYYLPPKGPRL